MARRWFQGITFALALVVLACGALSAQEFRATITGVVTDASKAVIPNAIVTVKNLDTGDVQVVKTTAAGVFSVPYLHPGQRFQVSAEATGFKKSTYPPITLEVSQTATANFVLQVGATNEEVTVTSDSYQVGLDTAKADRGVVVDNKTITQLPLDGRNPLSILDYTTGVTNEGGPGIEGTPNNMFNISFYTVNGTPAQNTEYTIDGMPDNANPWYSNGPSTVPSVDAMQEFKMVTNPYDAQYGRTASGVVSMELKSGTNALHGSVYEFAKRGYMDANSWANNYFGYNRPAHTEDQYGFEVDGPVYIPHLYNGRNKTFFMFNFERFKEVLPNFQTYDIPNAAWLQGDFTNFVDASGAMIPVYDPSTATTSDPTRQIFHNAAGQYNRIDQSRLNPIAVKVAGMMLASAKPTPNAIPGQLPWESIWVNTVPATSSSQNFVLKLDQILGSKDHISGSWIRSFNPSYSPNTPENVPWFNGSTFTEYHTNGGVDWVHTYRSNLLSDVRFSYQRYWRTDGPIAANLNFDPTTLGFPSSFIGQLPLQRGFPEINFNMQEQSSATGNGYNNWLAMSRDFYYMPDDTYSFAPTVTWVKNKHSIRAGIDIRDSHLLQTFQYQNTMSIAADGIATSEYWNSNDSNDVATAPDGTPLSQSDSGNAVLDFLIGQPNSVAVQNQRFQYYTQHYYAPWIQDDWKITPKFTLNLGFRYDLNGPPTERHNWINTGFDFNAVNPVDALVNHAAFPNLPTLKGGITFPSTSGSNRAWAQDYTKWQPRIGFAWQVLPGTVLRGGAGRLAMSPTTNPQTAGFTNNPSYTNSPDGGRTYYADNLANPFPGGIPPIPGASLGLATYLGKSVTFINPHYKLPSAIDGSLGIEQAMPHDGKIEVSYVMSRGYGMGKTYTGVDANIPLSKSCNATLGTAANPDPRKQCQNLTANPFYGVAGVSGSLGTNKKQSLYQMARPYPQFTGISESQNNWGRSWYNSLQTTYNQRLGWEQLNASWTWSKTMQSGGYRDDVYLTPARSIAGTDRQNRITVTSVLNLPIGRGMKYFSGMNRPVDILVGGWELATDAFWETGQPVGLNSGYNVVGNIRARGPRHNSAAIIDAGVNQCVQLWSNATSTTPGSYKTFTGNGQSDASCAGNIAWQQVAPYAPKTSQQYTDQVRGPGASQIDVNLSKNFKLAERLTMQLRMEEFNVLNHPNWYGAVDMNPKDTNFGTVNKVLTGGQSNNPRVGQLAVKLTW